MTYWHTHVSHLNEICLHFMANKLSNIINFETQNQQNDLCAQRRHRSAWASVQISSCRQRRLWSDCEDVQADLNLHWVHRSFCWFIILWLISNLHILLMLMLEVVLLYTSLLNPTYSGYPLYWFWASSPGYTCSWVVRLGRLGGKSGPLKKQMKIFHI